MLYATYLLKLVILVINLLNFVTKLRLCTVLLLCDVHFSSLLASLSVLVKICQAVVLPFYTAWVAVLYFTEYMRYTYIEFILNFFLKMQFNLPVSEVLVHDCSWLHVNRGQIMHHNYDGNSLHSRGLYEFTKSNMFSGYSTVWFVPFIVWAFRSAFEFAS